MNTSLVESIRAEFNRRVFEESYERIFQCMDLLNETQLWQRPNKNLSSIGNLVLHLCGNARQWIISGIGGESDIRHRDAEFSSGINVPKDKLKGMMADLQNEIQGIISGITEEELLRKRDVQVFNESGLSILIHVIEHFSYHTGQITWYTKFLRDVDMGYYKGLDLNNDQDGINH